MESDAGVPVHFCIGRNPWLKQTIKAKWWCLFMYHTDRITQFVAGLASLLVDLLSTSNKPHQQLNITSVTKWFYCCCFNKRPWTETNLRAYDSILKIIFCVSVNLRDVLAINSDNTRLDVVKPEEQADDGALARTRGTNQSISLATWNRKRYVVQDWATGKYQRKCDYYYCFCITAPLST